MLAFTFTDPTLATSPTGDQAREAPERVSSCGRRPTGVVRNILPQMFDNLLCSLHALTACDDLEMKLLIFYLKRSL